jgi:hypothetical protein
VAETTVPTSNISCKHCLKSFSSKSALYRHIRNNCKNVGNEKKQGHETHEEGSEEAPVCEKLACEPLAGGEPQEEVEEKIETGPVVSDEEAAVNKTDIIKQLLAVQVQMSKQKLVNVNIDKDAQITNPVIMFMKSGKWVVAEFQSAKPFAFHHDVDVWMHVALLTQEMRKGLPEGARKALAAVGVST